MSEIGGGGANLAKGALQSTTDFPLTHISLLHNSLMWGKPQLPQGTHALKDHAKNSCKQWGLPQKAWENEQAIAFDEQVCLYILPHFKLSRKRRALFKGALWRFFCKHTNIMFRFSVSQNILYVSLRSNKCVKCIFFFIKNFAKPIFKYLKLYIVCSHVCLLVVFSFTALAYCTFWISEIGLSVEC